ncbi:hypothetical protein GQ42DRAFT_5041 [Ramicandelaber brevisporus]|nr:hypothetical protein GQ42DRAFT_5041 [Ramicandelaber brevisporus]
MLGGRALPSILRLPASLQQPAAQLLDVPSSSRLLKLVSKHLVVIPDFVSQSEADALERTALRKLKRYSLPSGSGDSLTPKTVYETDHFDQVISGFRECTVSSWTSEASNTPAAAAAAVNDAKSEASLGSQSKAGSAIKHDENVSLTICSRFFSLFPDDFKWLPVHILELSPSGYIDHHVDNVGFSGEIVAGISLGTPCVIKFKRQDNAVIPEQIRIEGADELKELSREETSGFEAYIPPRSLYIQSGLVRYNYTHAIPVKEEERVFRGQPVSGGRRISVLFRDVPLAS